MDVHTEDQRTLAPEKRSTHPLPIAGALLFVAAAVAMAGSAWNAQVPDPGAHRVFLVVWAVAASLPGLRIATGRPPRSTLAFAVGGLLGTALATTPWQALEAVYWYQLWWSVPVLAGLAVAMSAVREPQPEPAHRPG
ncbi:hypothetical protein [Nocardiopsis algeriensis]|uniref:Uncharacterized protein n=1 Tax=Nocardiopsis algeriensis TaxID=1478215 RepID=A0A841IVT2_9ACTN|nr:hypothetical protein [Nocardiopsis algeriensis]MBB6120311.1 hypothetical protein [Nocardiopsis algeriensis]